MDSLVDMEVAALRERLAADTAHERPFSAVDPLVRFVRGAVGEGPRAEGAEVRPFSRVHALVYLQIAFARQFLTAHLAWIAGRATEGAAEGGAGSRWKGAARRLGKEIFVGESAAGLAREGGASVGERRLRERQHAWWGNAGHVHELGEA